MEKTLDFTDLPLDNRIIKALHTMQLTTLTEVQKQTIPYALQGKDILASSKTGSGKTLAFLVPIVNRLLSSRALSKRDPRAIILAPTRELAKQVYFQAKKLTNTQSLSSGLIVGGENYNDQVKLLRKNPDIIVATAGRLADHILGKSLFLNGIELLVLDEADRMLELGFADQLRLIHQKADHRKRQTMMFSATIDSAAIHGMTQSLLNNPVKVVIDNAALPHADIEQTFYLSDGVKHKDKLLLKSMVLDNREQAIVFTATREDTTRISDELKAEGFDAISLHGDLIQSQRSSIITAFSNNKHAILVTTDLASRGLDLLNVALVVNYDLPKFADEYIHRTGRTGRAGNQGKAISFVSRKDWPSFEKLKTKLTQNYRFSAYEDIDTGFKGVFPIHPRNDLAKSKHRKIVSPESNSHKKKPTKRMNTLLGTDAGMMPIKKAQRVITPSDEFDEE